MFNLNWLCGEVSSTNGPPMTSWFDPGVVCPDGTVMWGWDEDNSPSLLGDSHRSPNSSPLVRAAHTPEQVHYHYHRLSMGPLVFWGLQVSLAIALFLILSPNSQLPEQGTPVDSSAIRQPD